MRSNDLSSTIAGPSFGTSGLVRTGFGVGNLETTDYVSSVLQLANGKVLVGGFSNVKGSDDFALIRYNADGSLDASFNGTGKVFTGFGPGSSDNVSALASQGDGKILVAGTGLSQYLVARYNSDGSLDTSFNSTGYAAIKFGSSSWDYGKAIALQSDGKIIIAGNTNVGGSNDFGLVRINNDGSLDTSFNGTGKVVTDLGSSTDDTCVSVIVQSDGKILAAGDSRSTNRSFAVVRYNSDGSLDTSFNGTGIAINDIGFGANDRAIGVRVLSDGKIIAGGTRFSYNNNDFALIRLTSNGVLDTTFNGTGIVTTDIGTNTFDFAEAMELQSDGKVVLVGESDVTGQSAMTAVRYNTDGSLDTSFNGTGIFSTGVGTSDTDSANGVTLQNDGKILIAGRADSGSIGDYGVLRLTSAGALDPSFNGTGKVVTDGGKDSSETPSATALQADGKLLVAGTTDTSGSRDFFVMRYLPTGALDTSFNGTGKVLLEFANGASDNCTGLTVQSDGKILVVGTVNSNSGNIALARLNSGGSLDTSFNGTGKVTTDIGSNSYDYAASVVIQPNGKIVVAGETDANPNLHVAVLRYNSDGSLDSSFNSTGKVITSLGGTYEGATDLALQADGKIVVVGYTDALGSDDFALLRYNNDGSLDTSFNSTGKLVTDVAASSSDWASAIRVDANGKILVAGTTDASGTEDFVVLRYNGDGSFDTSFNGTGKVLTDIGASTSEQAYTMALQKDGKIILGGKITVSGVSQIALARYNSSGALDASFNGSGLITSPLGSQIESTALALAVQSDGKIFTVGKLSTPSEYSFDIGVVRFNADGSH